MKRLIIVALALLLVGCGLNQPTGDEIVRRAQAAMESMEQAHAIVEIEATVEGETMRVVGEGWMQGDSHRATVLEASEPALVGMLAVSDGQTGWLHHPEVDTVLTGDVAEMEAYRDQEAGELPAEVNIASLAEMVDELLRITDQTLLGSETIAGQDAWHLQLTPNEEAPPQLAALGATVELWISKQYDVPLQLTFSSEALGEGRVTVLEYEAEPTFDEGLFTFDPPAGAEVIDVATLLPERMTLVEARAAAGFPLLSTPSDGAEAALTELYRVQELYFQKFEGTLGEWMLVQGAPEGEWAGHHGEWQGEGETVTVRGQEGKLFRDSERGGVALVWQEAGHLVALSGDLSAETALGLAETLE